jgi:hypothetical protein
MKEQSNKHLLVRNNFLCEKYTLSSRACQALLQTFHNEACHRERGGKDAALGGGSGAFHIGKETAASTAERPPQGRALLFHTPSEKLGLAQAKLARVAGKAQTGLFLFFGGCQVDWLSLRAAARVKSKMLWACLALVW